MTDEIDATLPLSVAQLHLLKGTSLQKIQWEKNLQLLTVHDCSDCHTGK